MRGLLVALLVDMPQLPQAAPPACHLFAGKMVRMTRLDDAGWSAVCLHA